VSNNSYVTNAAISLRAGSSCPKIDPQQFIPAIYPGYALEAKRQQPHRLP